MSVMNAPEISGKQARSNQSKSDVLWVGNSTIEDGKLHYERCVIRDISVSINDFVMINTGDSFSIGRVLDLHDLGPFPDRNRAKIHWLYNHKDLIEVIPDCTLENRPNELFIPAFDPEQKPFKGSVEVMDAEAIEDVCRVTFLKERDSFPDDCTDKDSFYVMYAFDENFQVYSAVDYMEKLETALLKDSRTTNRNKKCRTPRTPRRRWRSSSAGMQWRIGTPKAENHSYSPFSLKPLKITLKACDSEKLKKKTPSKTRENKSITENEKVICTDADKLTETICSKKPPNRQASRNVTYKEKTESDNDNKRKKSTRSKGSSVNAEKRSAKKPPKRKASKSIPDEGEVEPKKTRIKSKQKLENTPAKKGTMKSVLSPCNNSFSADQVREQVLSDDYDDDEHSGYDSCEEVFFTEKTPEIDISTKRESRSQSKASQNSTKLKDKENQKSVSKQTSNPQYQTPKSALQSMSATGKPRGESVKSTKKVSVKTPRRKQSTKVVKDVLAGGMTPKKTPGRVGRSGRKSLAEGMTPSMPSRSQPCKTPRTPLQEARSRLHVSAVPTSLPCREDEFADILGFVEGKLIDGTGGCMYISGVPGTGKTATVHEVIKVLQDSQDEDISDFKFIEINGMKLTEPNQAYSMLLKKLTGQKATPAHASDLLEKMFTAKSTTKESLVLMVDELDLLWTRKQGVMYNLFEWPSRSQSKLIVLAIANTMDLPERMMINRVQSRLGLTRLTFQPYTYSQLQEIVLSRIKSLNVFDPDAMQLVARKVAAVSGDARRCLDICRRAVEITEQQDSKTKSKKGKFVTMAEVNLALQDMFSSPKIKLMMNLSSYEMLLMKAVLSEFKRTGVEETTFGDVFEELCNHCRLEGIETPSMTELSSILSRLGASRLLLVETGRLDLQRRISLNVNQDDVIYALRNHSMK